jgi:hypothetical protein
MVARMTYKAKEGSELEALLNMKKTGSHTWQDGVTVQEYWLSKTRNLDKDVQAFAWHHPVYKTPGGPPEKMNVPWIDVFVPYTWCAQIADPLGERPEILFNYKCCAEHIASLTKVINWVKRLLKQRVKEKA